jgi:hypothetical protein
MPLVSTSPLRWWRSRRRRIHRVSALRSSIRALRLLKLNPALLSVVSLIGVERLTSVLRVLSRRTVRRGRRVVSLLLSISVAARLAVLVVGCPTCAIVWRETSLATTARSDASVGCVRRRKHALRADLGKGTHEKHNAMKTTKSTIAARATQRPQLFQDE